MKPPLSAFDNAKKEAIRNNIVQRRKYGAKSMAGASKERLGPGCYTRDKDLNLIGTLKQSNSMQNFGTKVERGLALNSKSHPNLWYLPLQKSPKRITSESYLTTDQNGGMKFLPI